LKGPPFIIDDLHKKTKRIDFAYQQTKNAERINTADIITIVVIDVPTKSKDRAPIIQTSKKISIKKKVSSYT